MAVSHHDGPCIVTAVPGSGKTRVLTSRAIALVKERDILPRNILCLTFTNKAANEMKERVAASLGSSAGQIWISTFHRLCLAILRKHGSLIDLPSNFSVYAAKEQDELMTKLARMHEYDPISKYSIQKLTKAINDFREDIVDFEQHLQELNPLEVAIVKDYQETLDELNAVDFSGMLYKAWLILKENPAVCKAMANRFKFVLVDEFQDTNHVQYDILQRIAIHQNLFVVGDFQQCIYEWRGAKPENLKKFTKDFPSSSHIILPRNYRSTTPILRAAQNLIRNNYDARDVELHSDRGQGPNVRVSPFVDAEQEATIIAHNIQDLRHSHGYQWKDFAILYRANSLSRSPEMALRNRSMPYCIVGGFSFFDRMEIKTALSYLSLLVNPYDSINFARAVMNPKRGIGNDTIGKLEKLAETGSDPILNVCRTAKIPGMSSRAKTNLSKFVDLVDWYKSREGKIPLSTIAENLLKESGFYDQVKAIDKSEDNEKTRSENLDELIAGIAEFEERRSQPSVANYLQSIQLLTNDLQEEDEEDAIKLLTMHSAKGLEWPCVYVIGVERGRVPHAKAEAEGSTNEERRLLYVAMTRAKDYLHLTYCQTRRKRPAGRSYFLDEIS
ncbi:MAG: ATP-dependent helicase [Promethearchaeota archaeon]